MDLQVYCNLNQKEKMKYNKLIAVTLATLISTNVTADEWYSEYEGRGMTTYNSPEEVFKRNQDEMETYNESNGYWGTILKTFEQVQSDYESRARYFNDPKNVEAEWDVIHTFNEENGYWM